MCQMQKSTLECNIQIMGRQKNKNYLKQLIQQNKNYWIF